MREHLPPFKPKTTAAFKLALKPTRELAQFPNFVATMIAAAAVVVIIRCCLLIELERQYVTVIYLGHLGRAGCPLPVTVVIIIGP